MGGGASNLLKSGRAGLESAKQVEIRLANLLKILAIVRRAVQTAGEARTRHAEVVSADFRQMAN
jgi:hypothetical protein